MTEYPMLVLCRRRPDLAAIRSALTSRVPDGDAHLLARAFVTGESRGRV